MTDTDSLMKRCEALEAEQKRVAAQLEAVTRRVKKLEEDSVGLLNEIVSIHESDAELGKILMDLFQRISDTCFVERMFRRR